MSIEDKLAEVREQIRQFQQDRRELARQSIVILKPYTGLAYPEDIRSQARECIDTMRELESL